jgi:hypothetical protein
MVKNPLLTGLFITASFFLITLVGCAQQKSTGSMPSAHLAVSYTFPKADDLTFALRDTIHKYFYGDYVMYVLPHKSVFEGGNQTSTVADHVYYFYKKEGKYGFELRTLKDTIRNERTDKTTFLNQRVFASLNFPVDRPHDSLVASYTSKSADSLVEQYHVRNAWHGQYFDTSYYCYSKDMNSTPYTFSGGLDSSHGMKLYKARFIFAPMQQGNVSYPVREYSYQLIVMPPDELIESSIKSFIEKYKESFRFDQ